MVKKYRRILKQYNNLSPFLLEMLDLLGLAFIDNGSRLLSFFLSSVPCHPSLHHPSFSHFPIAIAIASSWYWPKIDFSEKKIPRNSYLRPSVLETCLVLLWSLAPALIIYFPLDISQQWTHCAADKVCKITFKFTKNVLICKKSRKNFTRILVFENNT